MINKNLYKSDQEVDHHLVYQQVDAKLKEPTVIKQTGPEVVAKA